MKKKIPEEFRIHKKYLLFTFFISNYVFFPQIFVVETFKQFLLFGISTIILWLLSKISKFIFLIAAFFTLLVSFIDIHLLHHWGDARLGPRLQVALLSPESETIEYLGTYFDWMDIIDISYLVAGVYVLLHMFRRHKNLMKYLKSVALVLLLLIFAGLSLVINPMDRIVPFPLVTKVAEANEWKSLVDKRMEFMAHRRAKYSGLKIPYDKLVVIIGESSTRNHMSAYGYPRKTTPFLEQLQSMNYGYLFPNAISPANATRYAIPLELTDATVGHFFDFLTLESLVTVMNDLGFATFWISNQSRAGEHETYVTSIAKEANVTTIANAFYTDQTSEKSKPDEILLDILQKTKPIKGVKQAYFFHLMGSHADYARRYTQNVKLIQHSENRIDHYDNSIFYTDFVMKKIFDMFKNDKTLFLYISDHGEYVGKSKSGHGTLGSNRDEVEVPFVVFSSIHNERIQALYDAKLPVINMEWFNTLVKYFLCIENSLPKDLNDTRIMTVTPNDIVDYRKLEYRRE